MDQDEADTTLSNLDTSNYEVFRDVFFAGLLSTAREPNTRPARRRHGSKKGSSSIPNPLAASQPESTHTTDEASDMAEFSDFMAGEVFPALPADLKQLSYQSLRKDSELADKWSLPLSHTTIEQITEILPPSVSDSLTAYSIVKPPQSDIQTFISPILNAYISATTVAPPKWASTRADACEICDRDWVPLTYHHLIPRAAHAKVLKRGWHDETMLNSVAWLCRACHNFVHAMANNEELAKEWFSIDRICERDDVKKWALWVGKARWKKR